MSKIIRYCKTKEEHFGPNVFDISRPNILGNPYTHIKNKQTMAQVVVESRDKAIDLYSKYFDSAYKKNEEFKKAVDELYEAFLKYDVIYLGCYCPIDMRCHGDIIRQKINERYLKEKMIQMIKEKNRR